MPNNLADEHTREIVTKITNAGRDVGQAAIAICDDQVHLGRQLVVISGTVLNKENRLIMVIAHRALRASIEF